MDDPPRVPCCKTAGRLRRKIERAGGVSQYVQDAVKRAAHDCVVAGLDIPPVQVCEMAADGIAALRRLWDAERED